MRANVGVYLEVGVFWGGKGSHSKSSWTETAYEALVVQLKPEEDVGKPDRSATRDSWGIAEAGSQ